MVFTPVQFLSLLQQNGFVRNPGWYFWREKQQSAGQFKSAWVFNWVRNYVWRWFTNETVWTMLQKGKEYYRIPFFVAGFIFFAEIVDRRVSCEKSPRLSTGWRITFYELGGEKAHWPSCAIFFWVGLLSHVFTLSSTGNSAKLYRWGITFSGFIANLSTAGSCYVCASWWEDFFRKTKFYLRLLTFLIAIEAKTIFTQLASAVTEKTDTLRWRDESPRVSYEKSNLAISIRILARLCR